MTFTFRLKHTASGNDRGNRAPLLTSKGISMKFNVYAVRDNKMNSFSPPWVQVNEAIAERTFRHLANEPSSSICKYPQDHDLYQIGEYDEKTGKLHPMDPVHKYSALALKNPEQGG